MADNATENLDIIKELRKSGHAFSSAGLQEYLRKAFPDHNVPIEELVGFLRDCMKKHTSSEDIKKCIVDKIEVYLKNKPKEPALLFPNKTDKFLKKLAQEKLDKTNKKNGPKLK